MMTFLRASSTVPCFSHLEDSRSVKRGYSLVCIWCFGRGAKTRVVDGDRVGTVEKDGVGEPLLPANLGVGIELRRLTHYLHQVGGISSDIHSPKWVNWTNKEKTKVIKTESIQFRCHPCSGQEFLLLSFVQHLAIWETSSCAHMDIHIHTNLS